MIKAGMITVYQVNNGYVIQTPEGVLYLVDEDFRPIETLSELPSEAKRA